MKTAVRLCFSWDYCQLNVIRLLSLHFTYNISNVEEQVDCYEFENALYPQIVVLVYGSCWCSKLDQFGLVVKTSHVVFKYQDKMPFCEFQTTAPVLLFFSMWSCFPPLSHLSNLTLIFTGGAAIITSFEMGFRIA